MARGCLEEEEQETLIRMRQCLEEEEDKLRESLVLVCIRVM